jgi:hypothetical protein
VQELRSLGEGQQTNIGKRVVHKLLSSVTQWGCQGEKPAKLLLLNEKIRRESRFASTKLDNIGQGTTVSATGRAVRKSLDI